MSTAPSQDQPATHGQGPAAEAEAEPQVIVWSGTLAIVVPMRRLEARWPNAACAIERRFGPLSPREQPLVAEAVVVSKSAASAFVSWNPRANAPCISLANRDRWDPPKGLPYFTGCEMSIVLNYLAGRTVCVPQPITSKRLLNLFTKLSHQFVRLTAVIESCLLTHAQSLFATRPAPADELQLALSPLRQGKTQSTLPENQAGTLRENQAGTLLICVKSSASELRTVCIEVAVSRPVGTIGRRVYAQRGPATIVSKIVDEASHTLDDDCLFMVGLGHKIEAAGTLAGCLIAIAAAEAESLIYCWAADDPEAVSVLAAKQLSPGLKTLRAVSPAHFVTVDASGTSHTVYLFGVDCETRDVCFLAKFRFPVPIPRALALSLPQTPDPAPIVAWGPAVAAWTAGHKIKLRAFGGESVHTIARFGTPIKAMCMIWPYLFVALDTVTYYKLTITEAEVEHELLPVGTTDSSTPDQLSDQPITCGACATAVYFTYPGTPRIVHEFKV